jgi:predicted  nucleic acid-binding Zn-ribbon protein
MEDMRFAEVMRRERERLNREREEIVERQKELENNLTEINREFAAIEAYEAAKPARLQRLPGDALVREGAECRLGNHRRRIALARELEAGGRRC